ncbi:MAG: hypothetical protein CEN87_417 [Parcubacteria group bacterium Licking1014_1]|nr:MAG: hypothetical protein CEN87_417 [Parcubacteria group bacterium Licking1014_1]
MKYYLVTFGCQMNISDSERISAVLDCAKCENAANINEADLIVVNMCSVRQSAVDRVYGLVQKIKKLKAKRYALKSILTGCVLKKDKKVFINGFDYVIDIKDINKLPQILKTDSVFFAPTKNNYLNITPKYSNKFSANVPIMTGCNNFCAYCVVPHTREREISRPAEEIICEIKNLIKNDCKEIWLLGQNVNSYKDIRENKDNNIFKSKHYLETSDRLFRGNVINFPKLLKMIDAIPGNFWIRFTSSHPKDFSDELIKTMTKCKRYKPYLNLPAQSGDDKILRKMNRPYTAAQYKNLVKKIRKAMPNISLSTDIIVGYPGETKKQFGNTTKLFKDIKFDMAYINKYSPRPGTAAAKLKNNILPAEKKRREKILTEILKATALEHNKKLIGKTLMVLVDSKRDNAYFGKSEDYKTMKIQNVKLKNDLIGKFVKVKIIKAQEWALDGVLV